MEKLTAASPEAQSADLVAGNIEQLKALFPELLTEGKDGVAVNVDVLKALVGDATVTDADEKYGLNWHGKRRARQLALTPSTGTLRPCPQDSVDWDTTQNLMIEGDNLEVLKLLQKSYAGKVKLIYIDPPYNTGKDFVYPDNFQDNIKNYLELTGQIEGGQKISSNTEASGRFHTDWLNMMYPRLKLARNLLKDNGFIFISIDDGEVENLRRACDEIFGEENFVAQLVWKSRVSEDTRAKTGVSTDHEYIVCYSRGDQVALRGSEKDIDKFSNPDNDPRGPWRSADLTGLATKESRPNLHYDLIDPKTGINYGCPQKGWRYERSTMSQKIDEGRILFPSNGDGRPRHKLFLNEMRSLYKNMSSVITEFSTADGTRDVNGLLGSGVFSFPKPTGLVASIIEQATEAEEIILDFFAGSGTLGHATLLRNAADSSNRRFVLVQLPEPLDPTTADQKVASDFCDKLGKPRTIAELTKERLRRAAAKVKADNPMSAGDTGFRVFKLDTSNIRAWNPKPDDLEASLFDHQDHLLEGRSEADVLYELLLKLGLDLIVPIEKRSIERLDVHAVGGGVLLACLAEKITREQVEPLAQGIITWHKELAPAGDTTCVFRDSAFADDVAKTNLAAILEQHGIQNVRSL
ncbi:MULTISPECIES: site-specific DNA-methyltransferase [Stenotrophomonas]|nr:site-specific DNA-methyltransferase [Stenotrophomonas maltophilia]MBH1888940.1 site-specific DNA-methyltransferase [Stenotrophomonas maltophilia]MCU1014753.1 site-specific DNA-methyltransferase [Stenotrophomonas maltophilia]HDS1129249.1 site-specific DNA-methyltransferase [Stenotrophomonas maltophilia]HDS1165253.1 site-specific DNA-methyltransferase [Stenotrophomonas maltophilia]HDS1176824.1 site-specific DNA-methyltransferase [Stenotrophomonas maltophilia]